MPPKIKAVIQKLIPWIFTLVIFLYLFYRIPFNNVLSALDSVNFSIFLPLAVGLLVYIFFLDSFLFSFLFRFFGNDIDYRTMTGIRGASYLMTIITFIAGHGGMAFILKRMKGVPVAVSSSLLLYELYMSYYTLLLFALAGVFQLQGVDLDRFFELSDAGHLVRFIVISWMVFGFNLLFRWLTINYHSRSRLLSWVKSKSIFTAFLEAPLSLYFKAGLIESAKYFTAVVVQYFALRTFGINVPFLELMVMLPIAWLVGAVPITVMKMGTMQMAMIWLLTPYAQGYGDPGALEAAILAYSLLWEIILIIGRFIIGTICMNRLPADLWIKFKSKKIEETAN